jgi:hypothetical protein
MPILDQHVLLVALASFTDESEAQFLRYWM